MSDVSGKVNMVNDILEGMGAAAVQKFAKLKSTGRDIYGYQPQMVFDAMNKVFGVTGWSHNIVDIGMHEKQVIARVAVVLGDRVSEQFGEHRIMGGDQGSAYKAAVTDGIQKALSLVGVGSKAYRGELGAVYNAKVSQVVHNDNYATMAEEIGAIKNKRDGRVWWTKNLAAIQCLAPADREKLVRALGGKDD